MACNTLQRSGSFALLTSELPEKRDATTLKRRYYSNLGLDAGTVARKEARVASPARASLPKATVLKLRGDRDDDLLQWLWSLFQAVTSPSSAAAGKKRKVRFSEDVTAVAIPSRDEYSYRVKDQAFHSMVEIRDMVTKNLLEFEAESFDWQKVVEEDGFAVCRLTGERVHPVFASTYEQQHQYYDTEADSDDCGGLFYDSD